MRGDPHPRSPHGADSGGAAAVSSAAAAGAAANTGSDSGAQIIQGENTAVWASWRNLWQVPTVILSVILIVMGLRSAMRPPMANDFDGALSQVEQFIAAGQVEPAFGQMRGLIEPNLDKATPDQQARFHALSADLTYVSQESSGERSDANNRHISQQYAIAEEMGLHLSPVRLERCGEAMLALGDFEGVQKQLETLHGAAGDADSGRAEHSAPATEPASRPDQSADELSSAQRVAASEAYGRLFRKLIETQLRRPDLDAARVMEMLTEYRMTTRLAQEHRLWIAARLAELRLETGHPEAAVDGLLVEMRRLESDSPKGRELPFGEMYLLLGRGYNEIGETVFAKQHLEHALKLLSASESARGDALALLGEIALAEGDDDAAYEKFNAVATEFVGTHSYLPGLLGKAQTESVTGDHASAQADFREVASILRKSPPRRDVTPQSVAQRLCDRHDAALAMGRMERGLEYIVIAQGLFAAESVPPDVLFRLASTNRQIAENLVAAAAGDAGADVNPDEIDPAVRYEANKRFQEAANDYLRHASAETTKPLSEEDWGASLWAAADCFDRGGQHRHAIEQFEKYLGSRGPDDPRKAEAMFRIAQGHQALLEYDDAAHWYEQVLAERTRSGFAARCHVPLARCYAALKRVDDARHTLQQVLSGEKLLEPDARDYRDALIELGRLHHDQGEHVEAIERLAEALQRYPDDPRIAEVRYLLADSYRGSALEIGKRLAQDTGISPAENGRLSAMRTEHLQKAQQTFAIIATADAPQPGRVVPPSVQDLVRRAHLYQADCAFELAQYDQAVELYESASRQYSGAASSMYALVQIVNCYAALGDAERAAAAHQRALLRLKQLPDSAFASPDALMDRGAWERWLNNSPVGSAAAATPAAANAASG